MASILDNIATTIKTRLENITKANSYAFDASVEESSHDINTWQPSVGKIIIQQEERERNEELSCPGNPAKIAFDVTFKIHGFHEQIDIDPEQPGVVDDTLRRNVVSGAIEQALANNDTAWHTFGGNAVLSDFMGDERVDAVGFRGVTVNLRVQYRVSELDPGVAA